MINRILWLIATYLLRRLPLGHVAHSPTDNGRWIRSAWWESYSDAERVAGVDGCVRFDLVRNGTVTHPHPIVGWILFTWVNRTNPNR